MGNRLGAAWPSVAATLRSPSVTQIVSLVAFLAVGITVAWFRTLHLDEAAALYGFSPSALIDPFWMKPQFASDFPNGEAEMMKSLMGWIYVLAGFLPLSRRAIVGGMVLAEFCTLGFGAYLCARAVNPGRPAWTGWVVALLLTTGAFIHSSLDHWFHPYYGSSYNFAYGFGLAALAAIFSRKPIWAGLGLGIAAAFHPLIALFFGIALATVALVDLSKFRFTRLVVGGAVACIVALGWTILVVGNASVSGNAVDPDLYIALTRLMSWHWFPITLGVFGDQSLTTLIPFAGFMVLVAVLLRPFRASSEPHDAGIGIAIVMLLIVTAVGVLASEFSGVPLLVKLALHRASSTALLLGAVVIAPRLASDVLSASYPRALLAAVILLLPFWRDHGPPFVFCILYAAIFVFEERDRQSRTELALVISAIAVAVVVAVALSGSQTISDDANLGFFAFRQPLFVLALALVAIARLFRTPVTLAVGIAIGALVWAPKVNPFPNTAELQRAKSYLQVQEWARTHTAPNALFMIDPTYYYSWREMSQRPSFGTLREWLYSGWIYNTQAKAFKEGLERAEWLGLDLKRYLNKPDRAVAYAEIWHDAKVMYNSLDAAKLEEGATKFGVSYFVFDRQNAKTLPDLPIAFENDRFAVLSAH